PPLTSASRESIRSPPSSSSRWHSPQVSNRTGRIFVLKNSACSRVGTWSRCPCAARETASAQAAASESIVVERRMTRDRYYAALSVTSGPAVLVQQPYDDQAPLCVSDAVQNPLRHRRRRRLAGAGDRGEFGDLLLLQHDVDRVAERAAAGGPRQP